jgi:hypothetical protein
LEGPTAGSVSFSAEDSLFKSDISKSDGKSLSVSPFSSTIFFLLSIAGVSKADSLISPGNRLKLPGDLNSKPPNLCAGEKYFSTALGNAQLNGVEATSIVFDVTAFLAGVSVVLVSTGFKDFCCALSLEYSLYFLTN